MDYSSNYHAQYLNVTSQHWHAESARFAGCDHLLTAVADGWMIDDCIEDTHYYDGRRAVNVYRFKLVREGQGYSMPVISSPFVVRFLKENRIPVRKPQSEQASILTA